MLTEVFAQTDHFINIESKDQFYFVSLHTINGGRFYSEPFKNIQDAIDRYLDFKNIGIYFGGGIVELFKIDEMDFDIISTSRV